MEVLALGLLAHIQSTNFYKAEMEGGADTIILDWTPGIMLGLSGQHSGSRLEFFSHTHDTMQGGRRFMSLPSNWFVWGRLLTRFCFFYPDSVDDECKLIGCPLLQWPKNLLYLLWSPYMFCVALQVKFFYLLDVKFTILTIIYVCASQSGIFHQNVATRFETYGIITTTRSTNITKIFIWTEKVAKYYSCLVTLYIQCPS